MLTRCDYRNISGQKHRLQKMLFLFKTCIPVFFTRKKYTFIF